MKGQGKAIEEAIPKPRARLQPALGNAINPGFGRSGLRFQPTNPTSGPPRRWGHMTRKRAWNAALTGNSSSRPRIFSRSLPNSSRLA